MTIRETRPEGIGLEDLEDTTITEQERQDRVNDASNQTEGASDNITVNTEEPVIRGTPISGMERPTKRQLERAGESRIRALTSLFGNDALVLGHLLFDVPPLAIRIKKGNITYRWKPMRTNESIAVKSGNGECHIEVDLAFVGFQQIRDSLQELIFLWKKAPFCFIENLHIRKMMMPNDPELSMSVRLEVLIMDAISGSPDSVYATLIMPWFNYKPYSVNFYYRRDWRPAGTNQPAVPSNASNRLIEGREEQEVQRESRSSTLLADINELEHIGRLPEIGIDYPPELGLQSRGYENDPADPMIAGTYPVVYPFNSIPFVNYVRSEERQTSRISAWTDGLTMNWNSFIRTRPSLRWQENQLRSQPDSPRRVTTSPQIDEAQDTDPTTRETWTVCSIVDGDTIWVWGTNDDGTREAKKIRLIFCDAPETYSNYQNSDYNTGGATPLPNGQDSYRPSSEQYGAIAKNALESTIGPGSLVRIEFYEKDIYNRDLGVIFKGDTNINLWLIQNGYVFASEGDTGTESTPYVLAQEEAMGSSGANSPRGVWAQQRVSLTGVPEGFSETILNNLRSLMRPSDWRTVYAPGTSYSGGSSPANCPPED
jgi:endonuclease YncB( thermonuclease family)